MKSSAKSKCWILSLLATAGVIAAARYLAYDSNAIMWALIGAALVAFLIVLVVDIVIFDDKGWAVLGYFLIAGTACGILGFKALTTPREELYWDRAVTEDTSIGYREFLADFSQGAHGREARDSMDLRMVDEQMRRKPYPDLLAIIEEEGCSQTYKKRAISYLDEYYNWHKQASRPIGYKLLKAYSKYRPDGPYSAEVREALLPIEDEEEYGLAVKSFTQKAFTSYLERFPAGKHAKEARDYLRYWNYSLKTGDKPYAYKYGRGEVGFSVIRVTASPKNDVILLVKHQGSKKVANHIYVRKNETGDLFLPSGEYRVFFYSGNGWHPYKVLESGLRGGFLHNESWGKDDHSRKITLTEGRKYLLEEVVYGNFSMSPSSPEEAL